jgi:hypothetical protein
MRVVPALLALVLAAPILAACSDDPSATIIAPLPDTNVYASVELRMQGHNLTNTTETKIYVDLVQFTGELIDNTLPPECDDCMFVISFAGAAITNGPHTIAVYFFEGEEQLATDSIPLVFSR